MEKTTLYLPAEVQRALRDISQRTGRPQADLIREALAVYLRQHARPPLRSVGAGDSADITGENSESWLRANWRPEC